MKNAFWTPLLFSFLLLSGVVSPSVGVGGAAWSQERDPFVVPPGLRARVDFWIDIFTKYGTNQSVLHNRHYPQVTMKVLDFSAVAETLSATDLQRLRERRVREEISAFEEAAKRLAAGHAPESEHERILATLRSNFGERLVNYKELAEDGIVRSQRGIRERYEQAIIRSGRYLPHMEKIFEEEFGLPRQLTMLPFIESSFVYEARSSAGAVGIWQFMPATGRQFLTMNNVVDERKDVLESTRAAAKYLRQGYTRLQSWPLAITAYNHGAAGVARRVRQLGTTDIVEIVESPSERVFGFASTNFYPEFLAAVEVMDNYQRYFPGVRRESPIAIATRPLSGSIAAASLASQTGISIDVLRELNPALVNSVWTGRTRIPAGYNVRVPLSAGERLASLTFAPASAGTRVAGSSATAGGATYTVRAGDTLGAIARRTGKSVGQLREINNLRSDVIRVGQVLRISESAAPGAPATAAGTGTYTVQAGDTLGSIASRHRMSVAELRRLNNLSGDLIRLGQVLRVSSAREYVVRAGDTLSSIAARHGVSAARLRQVNDISGDLIRVGQRLTIP